MTSEFMWEALEPYTYFTLGTSPFLVNYKTRKVILAQPPRILLWLILFVPSVALQAITEIIFFNSLLIRENGLQEVSPFHLLVSLNSTVFFVFYFIVFFTLLSRHQDLVQYINGLILLEKQYKRVWKPNKKEMKKTNGRATSLGLVVLGVNLTVFVALVSAFFGVIINVDTSRRYFPPFKKSTWRMYFLRWFHNMLTWFEVWRLCGLCILICIFFIAVTGLLIDRLATCSVCKYSVADFTGLKLPDGRRGIEFRNQIRLHHWLTIVERVNRVVTFAVGPFLFVFGFVVLVIGNYGCVQLYGKLDFISFSLFPVLSFSAFSVIYFLVPHVCKFHEESIGFLARLGHQSKDKCEKKCVKAIRPLRIHIGPFFYCSRTTKSVYFQEIVMNTANALLLF